MSIVLCLKTTPASLQAFWKLNLFAFSSEELVESHTEFGLTE